MNTEQDLRILNAEMIDELVGSDNGAVMDEIAHVYEMHETGQTVVPFSQFLRPDPELPNRFISLPAYLGGASPQAGIKFIASFPSNLRAGISRASAVIVLNCSETGRPIALLEGSLISVLRTAASAAVAARALVKQPPSEVGLVGCGPINRSVARFLKTVWPTIDVIAFDIDGNRAEAFAEGLSPSVCRVSTSAERCLQSPLISFATNSVKSSVPPSFEFDRSQTILHLSLRDLDVSHILSARNITDDVQHVNREDTSIHRASQFLNHLEFLAGTIGGVLRGKISARGDGDRPVVFSPFGLGVLDIALAGLALQRSLSLGRGMTVTNFFEAAV